MVILKEVQGCRDEIARLDRDMELDRRREQEKTLKLGEVANKLTEVLDGMVGMQTRIKGKVTDALKPLIEVTEELNTTIKNKKSYTPPEKRKRFWLF